MEDGRISPPPPRQTIWRRDCIASHANRREGLGPPSKFETAIVSAAACACCVAVGRRSRHRHVCRRRLNPRRGGVVGYTSIGIEKDNAYFDMAWQAIPVLAQLRIAKADQSR